MLTVVVLTHNSSEDLAALLPHLSFADRLLVVDDYSWDDTAIIAASYGARVMQRALNGDFAAQRNAALSKVRTRWVLFLDADERPSAELIKEIMRITSSKHPTADGYLIRRVDVFHGRRLSRGEVHDAWFVRLGKKRAGVWKRPVHEYWDIVYAKRLTGELEHFSHASLADFYQTITQYSTIESNYRFSKGEDWSLFELLFYPVGKFLYTYFLKMGFLDGVAGLVYSAMMSVHSFQVRAKLVGKHLSASQAAGVWSFVFRVVFYAILVLFSLGQIERIQLSTAIAVNLHEVLMAGLVLWWLFWFGLHKHMFYPTYVKPLGLFLFTLVLSNLFHHRSFISGEYFALLYFLRVCALLSIWVCAVPGKMSWLGSY